MRSDLEIAMTSTAYQSLADRLDRREPHAVAAMLALAETGDVDAQFKASELTLRGQAGLIDLVAAHRWMANAAETVGSVATSASSRHCPSGSRTSTTVTGSSPQPVYHRTPRTTWMRRRRSCQGQRALNR